MRLLVWEKSLQVVDRPFEEFPGDCGSQEGEAKLQRDERRGSRMQGSGGDKVIQKRAHNFMIEVEPVIDRAARDERPELQNRAPPTREAKCGMANQAGCTEGEGGRRDNKARHTGKLDVIQYGQGNISSKTNPTDESESPAAPGPRSGFVNQHSQQRARRQRIEADGQQDFASEAGEIEKLRKQPVNGPHGNRGREDRDEALARREEDDYWPEEIKLFFHRKGPEVRNPFGKIAVDNELEIAEIGEVPQELWTNFFGPEDKQDDEDEIVDRENPQKSARVKLPQREAD